MQRKPTSQSELRHRKLQWSRVGGQFWSCSRAGLENRQSERTWRHPERQKTPAKAEWKQTNSDGVIPVSPASDGSAAQEDLVLHFELPGLKPQVGISRLDLGLESQLWRRFVLAKQVHGTTSAAGSDTSRLDWKELNEHNLTGLRNSSIFLFVMIFLAFKHYENNIIEIKLFCFVFHNNSCLVL